MTAPGAAPSIPSQQDNWSLKDLALTRNPFDISDKRIVILGGSGTLGRATLTALYQHGASVAVVGRSEQKLAKLQSQIQEVPLLFKDMARPELLTIQSEDASEASLVNSRDAVFERFGRVDVLICMVGGNTKNATAAPGTSIPKMDLTAIWDVINLNFREGFLNPVHVFSSLMGSQGRPSSVIGTSSMAAIRPLTRVLGYGAAKAAVESYAKGLANELPIREKSPIRVNLITPGFIIADQNRALLIDSAGQPTDRGQKILDHTPLRRFGEPQDVAKVIVSLASDAYAFVNGHSLVVDGGFQLSSI